MRYRAAVVLAAAFAVCATIAAQTRRDGQWEITMKMEMPGMPMQMPPLTSTRCITAAEANDPQKMMPPQSGRGRNGADAPKCTTSDMKTEGNKSTWTMKCEGPQPMTGTGEMTYSENAYTGVMKMEMGGTGGAGGMAMTMMYSGKRLGECPKQP